MPLFPKDQAKFRTRECPRDYTPLAKEKLAVRGPDVTIDRCPKCQGLFLDKNELLRLTGDLKLNKYLRDEVALDSDSKLLCPHCGGIMDTEHGVAGVDIDVCLDCFGLWLDKGELEALTARRNSDGIELTADKQVELERATVATSQQRKGKAAALAPRAGPLKARHAAGGLLEQYDRALSEIVRRYP